MAVSWLATGFCRSGSWRFIPIELWWTAVCAPLETASSSKSGRTPICSGLSPFTSTGMSDALGGGGRGRGGKTRTPPPPSHPGRTSLALAWSSSELTARRASRSEAAGCPECCTRYCSCAASSTVSGNAALQYSRSRERTMATWMGGGTQPVSYPGSWSSQSHGSSECSHEPGRHPVESRVQCRAE